MTAVGTVEPVVQVAAFRPVCSSDGAERAALGWTGFPLLEEHLETQEQEA